MLSAIHQNASTWYLYTGDRGVIDGLLNKPMITAVETVFGKAVPAAFIYFIQALSILQVVAMTYVNAQQGWDSVALLSFILFSKLLIGICGRQSSLARNWLRRHHIKVEAKTFLFSGRVAMLGAIQVFKKNSSSSWMDSILHRNARLDAILRGLSGPEQEYEKVLATLEEVEQALVQLNVRQAHRGAELMNNCLITV